MTENNKVPKYSVLKTLLLYSANREASQVQDQTYLGYLKDVSILSQIVGDDILFEPRLAFTSSPGASKYEREFSKIFRDMLIEVLGPKTFGESSDEETTKALDSFYNDAYKIFYTRFPQRLKKHISNPTQKVYTIKRIIGTGADGKNRFDRGLKEYSVTVDQPMEEGRVKPIELADGLEELQKSVQHKDTQVISEIKQLSPGDFKRGSSNREWSTGADAGSYVITAKNAGGESVTISRRMLKEKIVDILSDMIIYYRSEEGRSAFMQSLAKTFEGTESLKGLSRKDLANMNFEAFFIPKVDKKRLDSLESASIREEDTILPSIGDRDTALIAELKKVSSIDYKVHDKKVTSKRLALEISFPDLEDEGILSKGQTYTIYAPEGLKDISIGMHTFDVPDEGKTPRGVRLEFKDIKESRGQSIQEVMKDVTFDGSDIKQFTRGLTNKYIDHLFAKEDGKRPAALEEFAGIIKVNNKSVSEYGSLGGLIDEGPTESAPQKVEKDLLEHIEQEVSEEESKKEQVKETYLDSDAILSVISDGLKGSDAGTLVSRIAGTFPEVPEKTTTLQGIFQSREFVGWLLDIMTREAVPLQNKQEMSPGIVYAKSLLKSGEAFKVLKKTFGLIQRALPSLTGGRELPNDPLDAVIDYMNKLTDVAYRDILYKSLLPTIRKNIYELYMQKDPVVQKVLRHSGFHDMSVFYSMYETEAKSRLKRISDQLLYAGGIEKKGIEAATIKKVSALKDLMAVQESFKETIKPSVISAVKKDMKIDTFFKGLESTLIAQGGSFSSKGKTGEKEKEADHYYDVFYKYIEKYFEQILAGVQAEVQKKLAFDMSVEALEFAASSDFTSELISRVYHNQKDTLNVH